MFGLSLLRGCRTSRPDWRFFISRLSLDFGLLAISLSVGLLLLPFGPVLVEKSELIGLVDLLQKGLKKKKVPYLPATTQKNHKIENPRKIQILTVSPQTKNPEALAVARIRSTQHAGFFLASLSQQGRQCFQEAVQTIRRHRSDPREAQMDRRLATDRGCPRGGAGPHSRLCA